MNISLTQHYEQLVKSCVNSGRYSNASEVVGEALRLWEESYDAAAQLKAAAQQGFDDVLNGKVTRVANEEGFIIMARA